MVGGGGIAPLTGSESDICELQRCIFFRLSAAKGWQKTGLNGDGAGARDGFQTLLSGNDRFLKEAIALYEHLGFEHIDYALGCTGHVDCEVRMLRELKKCPRVQLAGIRTLTTYVLFMPDVT